MRVATLGYVVLGLIVVGCGDDDGGGQVTSRAFDPAGCSALGLALGETTVVDIEHDGLARSYRVHVPDDIDPAQPTPLLMNWHGLTSNGLQQEAYAGNAEATARGYIVAYPEGLGEPGGQSFNGGNCCSRIGNPPHEADDVGFGRAIVADVASKLCIDRTRVYTAGMSNGGYMTDYNACEAADLYAAAAPVSALAIPRVDCNPARPIPMIAFNGTTDPLVPYAGSQLAMDDWAVRNGCEGEPVRESFGDSYCDTWSDCADGAEVVACTIEGMDHCWPGNPIRIPGFCQSGGLDDIDANVAMYDFFARHTLP